MPKRRASSACTAACTIPVTASVVGAGEPEEGTVVGGVVVVEVVRVDPGSVGGDTLEADDILHADAVG